jgi:outer membrane protein assembly factor BamB
MSDAGLEKRRQEPSRPSTQLRLWPGVVAACALALALLMLPRLGLNVLLIGMLGPIAAELLVLLWWLFFSRAPWGERFAALGLLALALFLVKPFVHSSITGTGTGPLFFILAPPWLCLALVAAVAVARKGGSKERLALIAAALLLTGASFATIRAGGANAAGVWDFAWRWTPTPEERLLGTAMATADAAHAPGSPLPALDPAGAAEWPGFRGARRDGVLPGATIDPSWASSPPVEVWRRPIGPGWSSFAVQGDRLYTQEQRGADEVVSCYDARTGEPVWQHNDPARFWEATGGAGPRGTPTLAGGRVYSFGGTGILNALDAATGAVVWTRQAATEAGTEIPQWGFSSSPLVVDDLVVVAVSGRLMAYDAATGEPRWQGPRGKISYSSPHLATLDGVRQVLQLHGGGLTGVAPEDGRVLWQHAWDGYPIVQPALTADGDVLISIGQGSGVRRLAIARQGDAWQVTERWTSSALKPHFNDFVVHRGHAFGFDGSILACIDLADGKRRWKGGRYGRGQLILLAGQDLLLVLGEAGELALVEALPDQFAEAARVPALKGKTWNHPVLVGDLLLMRNDQEMAAFRLRRSSTAG